MKGVILYKSKYGATRKYAEWLAEETHFDRVEISKAKISVIQKYDVIIVGGGIYASGIAGLSFLRKNIKALQNKKIMVFCDGASPFDDKVFETIKENNMKGELKNIPCFYFRGAWDLKGMHLIDRSLCKLLIKSVARKKPNELEVWERYMLDYAYQKCDWTDKKNLAPILEAINHDN